MGPGVRLACTAGPISCVCGVSRNPSRVGSLPFPSLPETRREALGRPPRTGLPPSGLPGFPVPSRTPPPGVSRTIRCSPPALVSALVLPFREPGVPAVPCRGLGCWARPAAFRGGRWGPRGAAEASAAVPAVVPVGAKSPRVPLPAEGPAELPLLARLRAGNQALEAPGARGRALDLDAAGLRVLPTPFKVSVVVCVLYSGSLSVLDSVSLSAPTSTPVPSPTSTARPGAAAAAGRLRGRGGGSSQEAGLVVIFGYLAV